MDERRRLLSESNGSPGAPVMFVGEAPGRLGAQITGVPFSGDRSGTRFEALLAAAGWTRSDVFVTNAVLCNPLSADGRRNRPPSRAELAACAEHLAHQLAIVDPLVVAPLGAVALAALDRLVPHGLTLGQAGQGFQWYGRWLWPLYHPSDRAMRYRPFPAQVADVKALRAFVDGLTDR
jgi:DNA polymerase